MPSQTVLAAMRNKLAAEAIKLKAQGKIHEARGVARASLLFEDHLRLLQSKEETQVYGVRPSGRVDGFPVSGMLCSICHQPQYSTPSGNTCKNMHGGAPSLEGDDLAAVLRVKPGLRDYVMNIGFPPPPSVAGASAI